MTKLVAEVYSAQPETGDRVVQAISILFMVYIVTHDLGLAYWQYAWTNYPLKSFQIGCLHDWKRDN